MVTTRDVTFALTLTSDFALCGYILVRTEHPKLFIMAISPGRTFKDKSKTSVENLDIRLCQSKIYIRRTTHENAIDHAICRHNETKMYLRTVGIKKCIFSNKGESVTSHTDQKNYQMEIELAISNFFYICYYISILYIKIKLGIVRESTLQHIHSIHVY